MPEPAWRAAEEEWFERESVRFQEEVASDPTVASDADRVAQLYLDGKLDNERLGD